MSNAKLSLVLSTNWLNKSEVPITLSLGSSNLLEQLTDLRKTFYLLDYCFIINGCKSAEGLVEGDTDGVGWPTCGGSNQTLEVTSDQSWWTL